MSSRELYFSMDTVSYCLRKFGWDTEPIGSYAIPSYVQPLFGYDRRPFLIEGVVLGIKHIPIGIPEVSDDRCHWSFLIPDYSKETNIAIANQITERHLVSVSYDDFIYGCENRECMFPRVIDDLIRLNDNWKDFPHEMDYEVVVKLCEALKKYDALKDELSTHSIENLIKRKREDIKSIQSSISTLECGLNRVYEDAAEALNYLEEHGYRQEDLDKKQEIIEESKLSRLGDWRVSDCNCVYN